MSVLVDKPSVREGPGYGNSILGAVEVLERFLARFGTWQAGSQTDLGMVQETAQARAYSQ